MKKEKIIIIEVYQINRKLFFLFPFFFIIVYLPPKKGLLSGDPNYTTLYQGLLPLFAQQYPKIEANVIFKIETKIPKIRN